MLTITIPQITQEEAEFLSVLVLAHGYIVSNCWSENSHLELSDSTAPALNHNTSLLSCGCSQKFSVRIVKYNMADWASMEAILL